MTKSLMRTALVSFGLIMVHLTGLGTVSAQQMEPPALPHQFYGTVTIGAAAAPDGTRVSAEVNGIEAKADHAQQGKYGYDAGDLFRVEGATGDEVVFKVNGVVAEETGVLKSGASTEVNLSATQTPGDSLVARYDTNRNGMMDRSEVIAAIRHYLTGVGGITRSDVIRLIRLYLSGG